MLGNRKLPGVVPLEVTMLQLKSESEALNNSNATQALYDK